MNLRKTWQRTALWLGIGWSILWSLVLADLPLIQQLTLIQQHPTQLVVVLPTSTAAQPHPSEWRNYQYLLPPNPDQDRLLTPESLLGFVEYEPEAKQPTSTHSTARQAHLWGQFTLTRYLDRTSTFHSAALLSLQKFRTQTNPRQSLPPLPSQTPIHIQFWGSTGTFPTLSAPAVLANSPKLPISRQLWAVMYGTILGTMLHSRAPHLTHLGRNSLVCDRVDGTRTATRYDRTATM